VRPQESALFSSADPTSQEMFATSFRRSFGHRGRWEAWPAAARGFLPAPDRDGRV